MAVVDEAGRVFLVGRWFTQAEIDEICSIVVMYPKLSRTELSCTICECVGWVTTSGAPKRKSGEQLLDRLSEMGLFAARLAMPKVQNEKPPGCGLRTGPPIQELNGFAGKLGKVVCRPVEDRAEAAVWNEYVERYHPLGYKRPFGAHMRYFIECQSGGKLGCFLFSASAWALEKRDLWIGWDEIHRSQRLNYIVNNTRFLIFPWVKVKYLASKVLGTIARQIQTDWHARYGYRPVLLETFVDKSQYAGTCYRAANWIYLGDTAGRGRMDRYSQYLSSPKAIFVYPLRSDFRSVLLTEVTWPNEQIEGQE